MQNKDYVGKYKLAGTSVPSFEIIERKGVLYAKTPYSADRLEMDPEIADVFTSLNSDSPIKFSRNAQGQVERISLTMMEAKVEGKKE